jgi:hypothetical protein
MHLYNCLSAFLYSLKTFTDDPFPVHSAPCPDTNLYYKTRRGHLHLFSFLFISAFSRKSSRIVFKFFMIIGGGSLTSVLVFRHAGHQTNFTQ